jgi:dihydrofolate reductase
MRKLILQEFVSLDGFAADAEGTTSFFESLTGEKGREVDEDLLRFIGTIDTILLGANTYTMFVDFWPNATNEEQLVADALNKTDKIVFSKRIIQAPWGKWPQAKVIPTSASEHIKKMKQQPGKDMVLWGSISLAQSLMKDDVIDEIQLRICPIVLGKGRSLFSEDIASIDLTLNETKVYQCGVIMLSYKPAKVSGKVSV